MEIVDADVHLSITREMLLPYLDEPWRRQAVASSESHVFPRDIGDELLGGRLKRSAKETAELDGAIAARCRIVIPTQLLGLGLQPIRELDAAVATAYARWLTEEYLPIHPRDRGLLCLPVRDAAAACALVRRFGGRPGVVGALLTYASTRRPHDNRYADLYHEMQDRGLVLAFHPTWLWRQPPFELFTKFMPAWAFGYPFEQCVQMVNWISHGMPERFPHLRCLFYEAGIVWLSFIAHRLDQEFMKRPSEAPLLRERPSHYVARYFYSTHPVDRVRDPELLESSIRLVGARQFLYGSNVPQWDCDLPSAVADLTCLSADEKAQILAENATALFGLS